MPLYHVSQIISVVDFFVQIMHQFLFDIFIKVMGLSAWGRFMLSAWNEEKKVRYRG